MGWGVCVAVGSGVLVGMSVAVEVFVGVGVAVAVGVGVFVAVGVGVYVRVALSLPTRDNCTGEFWLKAIENVGVLNQVVKPKITMMMSRAQGSSAGRGVVKAPVEM